MTHIMALNLIPCRVVRAFTIAGILLAFLAFCCASSGNAYAQDDNGDGVKVYQYDEGNSIIPKPGSGVAPESITDRGGALQITLLGLLVLFPIVAIVSVRRQGRKNLQET
tara:strand:+ start:152 stop:481 length:330 start_codon:yes stop_codon:yes gene_type:complete